MKTIKHNPVSLLTTYYGKNQNNFKFNVALSNASVNNVFYPTQYSNEKNYHLAVNFFNFNSIGKFYKDRGKLSPILNRSLVAAISDQHFLRVRNSSNVEAQSEKMLINGSTVEFLETSSNSTRFSNMNYVASQSYVIHDISNNYIPANKSICSVMTLGTASTDSHYNSSNLFLIADNTIRQYFVSGHQILDETLGLNLKSYYNTFDNECLNQDELYSKSSILGRSIDLFSNPDEIAPIAIPFMNSQALCYNHFAILNPIGWTRASGIPSGPIVITNANNERLRFLPLTYNYETREARILGINYNMYFKNASKFEYKSYDLKFIQYKIDSLSTNPTTDITTTDTQIIQSANEIPYNMNYNIGFSKTLKNGETLFSLLKKDKIVGMNMKRSVMYNKLFFKDLEFITGLTFEMKISRLYSRLEFEINKNINTALISYKDNYLYVGDNKIQFFETVIDEENNPYESEIFPLNDISRESFIIKLVKTNTGFDIFINEYKSILIVEDIHSLYSDSSLVVQGILCLEYVKLYDNIETIDEILTEREIHNIKQIDAKVNIKSIVFPATISLSNSLNTYQQIYLPPGTHRINVTDAGALVYCSIYNSKYQIIKSFEKSATSTTLVGTITIHEFGLYYVRVSNVSSNTYNLRITLASATYNYNTKYTLNNLEYKNMFILADYTSITFPDEFQFQDKKWRYIGNANLNQKIELKIGVSTYTFNCDIDNGRIIPNYSIAFDADFDVYISPQGNDTTGNGTRTNPWKTLKNCQRGQLIGLLPGVYSDAANEYGQVVNLMGGNTCLHGLLYNAFGTPDYTAPNSGYVMPANLRNGVTGFSGRTGLSIFISAVMPGTVIITMRTTGERDYPFYQGNTGFHYDIVFANMIVNASRGKGNYSNSYSRRIQFGLFVNMQFNETGYYTLQYNNDSNNPVGYVNCAFTGTRQSNYSGVSRVVSNPALNNEVLPSNNSLTLFNYEYLDHNILKVVSDSKLVHSNVIAYLENPGAIATYIKLDNKDIEIPNFGSVICNHTDIIIDRFNQYKYTSNIFTFDDYTKIKFNILDDIELNEIQIINDVEILIPININTEYDISEFMTKQFSLKSSTNEYNYHSEIIYSLIKTGTRIVEEIQTDEEGNETIVEHEESYDIIVSHKMSIYHNVYNDEHIKSLNRYSRTFNIVESSYAFNRYENDLLIKSNNFNIDSMNIKDYVVSNNNKLKLFSNDTDMHDINTLLYEYNNKKYCVIFNGTCDKHDVYLLEIKKYQDVSYVPDQSATQPEDWVVEYDEDGNEILWEPPLIPIYDERVEFEFIDSLLNTVRKPIPANENDHSTYLFLYYDSDNLMKIRRLYLTDKIEIFETNISNEFNQKLIPHAFKFEKYETMDQLLVNMYKVGDEFRLLVNTNFRAVNGGINREDRISYVYDLKKDIFVETEIIQIKTTSTVKDENNQDIEIEVLTNEFILTGIVENIFKEKLTNSTITLNIFDDSKSILIKDENDNYINYGKSDIVIHTDSEAKFELNIKIDSDINKIHNYFDKAKFIFKIYKFLDAYSFTNNILREI